MGTRPGGLGWDGAGLEAGRARAGAGMEGGPQLAPEREGTHGASGAGYSGRAARGRPGGSRQVSRVGGLDQGAGPGSREVAASV